MLLIDCHEPAGIIEHLQSRIPTATLKLKYGDYSFSDIVIERKTLSDFFTSLKNNRLQEQMESISRYYTDKYLLLEGFFDFSFVNNIDFLYSKLLDLMLDFDVKIIFSKDTEQTVRIIKKLYYKKNFLYINNVEKKDKIYHAVRFFGIHRKRLEIMFSKFGSISSIAKADKKDFKGIKSIGKKTRDKVKRVLNENIFQTP